jgi:glycine oxidase
MDPDVIVIGAGIIGCATAYELTRRGLTVTLVDSRGARGVGLGATQASAGVLAPYIEGHDNPVLTRLGAASLAMYDEFISRVCAESGYEVPYQRTGTLEAALDEDRASALRSSADRLRAVGVRCEWLEGRAAREAEPLLSADVRGALLVPDHGFVAAGALTQALASILTLRSVTIVPAVTSRVSRRSGDVSVETSAGELGARNAVLAAGSWSGQIEVTGAPPAPVKPVRGQLLTLATPRASLARVTWGSHCYLVPWPDGSLLVGATVEDAGFDERATAAGVRDLLIAACELVPDLRSAGFSGTRVGLRPATRDELPMVGMSRSVPGLVYATGHYRNGILLAPLTASVVADLIEKKTGDAELASMTPQRFGPF